MRLFKAFIHIFLLTLLVNSSAYAGITILQPMRFGELVITNNDSMHTITINTDGSYSNSPSILIITAPQEGRYEIDGLVPSSVITVTASQNMPLSGGGNTFTLKNFQVIHSNSDATGVASVTLGGDAETTGSGMNYSDLTYNGSIDLEVTY